MGPPIYPCVEGLALRELQRLVSSCAQSALTLSWKVPISTARWKGNSLARQDTDGDRRASYPHAPCKLPLSIFELSFI